MFSKCDSALCLRVILPIDYYFKFCFFVYEPLLNFSNSSNLKKYYPKQTIKTLINLSIKINSSCLKR